MFEHLLLDGDALVHQLASVSGQQLEPDVGGIGFGLRQTEAVDGGAMDGGEVGVVGLVAGIRGESILFGGVGVDDADLEPCLPEGAPDRAVIASGTLDDHDRILDVVAVHCGAHGQDGGIEGRSVVLDGGRLDQDSAVEVGEQDLGAGLGAVDAHEGEVFGTDGEDARVDDTERLMKGMFLRLATVLRAGWDGHGTDLRIELRMALNSHSGVCSWDQ